MRYMLVVEDNEVLRIYFRAMLLHLVGSDELQVKECVDGGEAFTFVEDVGPESIACVFSDFEMPRVNGEALARALVTLDQTFVERFVLITSRDREYVPQLFQQFGIPTVTKPVSKQQLRALLVRVGVLSSSS